MGRTKQRVSVDGSAGPLKQPLPGLAALRDKLPAAAHPPLPEEPASPSVSSADTSTRRASVYGRSAKLVIRRERKGHGGKIAIRIEGVLGSTRELEEALRELKRALGCGATLDGGDIVVQGALGERLVAFLGERGARKIVVGS